MAWVERLGRAGDRKMTYAEIVEELDKIMEQLMEEPTSPSIMARLAALRAKISRQPARS